MNITLDNLSFERLRDLLNGKGHTKLNQGIQLAVDTAVLCFPQYFAPWKALCDELHLDKALEWVRFLDKDPADTVTDAVEELTGLFQQDNSASGWYDRMELAQLLMVYTAFYDTLRKQIVALEGDLEVKGEARERVTRQGIADYVRRIEEKEGARSALHTALPLPALPLALNGFDHWLKELEEFYGSLSQRLQQEYRGLAAAEQMGDRLNAALVQLPELAAREYRSQYVALGQKCPDFGHWSQMRELHSAQRAIDVGFRSIHEEIRYYAAGEDRVEQTLSELADGHQAWLARPLLESGRADSLPPGLVLPTKQQGFVPQRYIVVPRDRERPGPPEFLQEESRDGLGEAIYHILLHPAHGSHPLVILGHPGAGKTMLCHMLAGQVLSSFFHVIILPLRYADPEQTFTSQIDTQLKREEIGDCTWDQIRRASRQKPVLLIFDGYDELLQVTGKTQADYLTRLDNFQQKEWRRGNRIGVMVTSRFSLIDKAEIPPESTVLRLCEFTPEQIKVWTGIWNDVNRQYQAEKGLAPFTVEHHESAREMAKQPLLLTMLALYDAVGNKLNQSASLNRGQLCANLVDEFLSRERGKEEAFRRMTCRERQQALDPLRRRLEIAALGMFNRGSSDIHREDLDYDLSALEGQSPAEVGELKAAEKLIGSFFFIHADRRGEREMCYSFLHNTFKEYLTAAWLLRALAGYTDRQEAMPWYAATTFTPLCALPEVMELFCQWREEGFHRYGIRSREAVLQVLRGELERCCTGEAVLDLDHFRKDFRLTRNGAEAPEQPSLLRTLAVYSLNLVLLYVLCNGKEGLLCPAGDGSLWPDAALRDGTQWRQLTGLWQSACTDEELYALSRCVEPLDNKAGFHWSWIEQWNRKRSESPLARLYRVQKVLNRKDGVALTGTLGGYPEEWPILQGIEESGLKLESEYRMQQLLREMYKLDSNQDNLLERLKKLLDAVVNEHNPAGATAFLSMLVGLLDAGMLEGKEQACSDLVNRCALGLSFRGGGDTPYSALFWNVMADCLLHVAPSALSVGYVITAVSNYGFHRREPLRTKLLTLLDRLPGGAYLPQQIIDELHREN